MREQIKELCFFMICGQTLLHFQSGKKYEKICRMILELLVLAGVVGMILNFLQSLGIQKGDMPATGGAVANMQRNMEEALLRQLDFDSLNEELTDGIPMEDLVEKYTLEEIKSKYDHFAGQYGFEIVSMEQEEDKLQVFVKETDDYYGKTEADGQTEGEASDGEETKEEMENAAGEGNTVETEEIRRVEIEKVDIDVERTQEKTTGKKEQEDAETEKDKEQLGEFRRQLALVFAMEEEKLEVVLID